MEGLFLLTHDIIKTMYVTQGYLPDLPYHLISDEEMFDAFIFEDTNFFSDNYACPLNMEAQYNTLKSAILYHINQYKENQTSSVSSSTYIIPDWVYSYMLGAVVSPTSAELDRHDLLVLLGMDNIDDEFTPEIYAEIYNKSKQWTYKLTVIEREYRPPTMFGEPHVIKSLRILNV